jgi:hypothetical protein
MQFDPVEGVATTLWYDQYARVEAIDPTNGVAPTNWQAATYSRNWFQDDNTWADAGSNYFYYAWADRSGTWTNNFWWSSTNAWPTNIGRPMSDVKLAIIQQ